MPTVLITGASRGIGLEFVRQYASEGWHVIGTCRNLMSATELAAVDSDVDIRTLDVTDTESISQLATDLDGVAIDVLINSAGIYGPRDYSYQDIDYQEWMAVIETNVFSPLKVSLALLPHVARSDQKKVITVSSKMGSIGLNASAGDAIYKSSKSAVNSVMRGFSFEVKDQGISVWVVHPGWVRTDMGGPNASVSVEDSVAGMRDVIDRLELSSSGTFYNYDGQDLAW